MYGLSSIGIGSEIVHVHRIYTKEDTEYIGHKRSFVSIPKFNQ